MNKAKYLYFNSRDELFRLDVTKIVYFESDGNYTHIILNNKMRATVGMNLSRMQSILNDYLLDKGSRFARIGRRHIINLTCVYRIAILKQRLVLSDGASFEYTLNVSKEALKNLRDWYLTGRVAYRTS